MELVKILSGSRLYGTHREDSDYDTRGVILDPIESLLTTQKEFEQYETKTPDTIMYGLKKFCRLALASNPNILEILFCPEDKWISHEGEWRWIYNIRHSFLSNKARTTYIGYSTSQISLIRRHSDAKNPTNSHAHFVEKFGYDTKAAAHLLRLFYQGRELLTKNEFTPVLSGDELTRVKGVLNGECSFEEFQNIAEVCINELKEFKTELPDKPDVEAVNEMIKDIFMERICRSK